MPLTPSEAVAQLIADQALFDAVVNGPDNATVVLGSGTVPTIPKLLKDTNDLFAAFGLANNIIDFGYQAALSGATVPALIKAVRLWGYAAMGDGGHAMYRRVTSQPSHSGKVRSTDRFLPDGTTSSGNGGWWEIMPDARGANAKAFGAIADGVLAGDRSFSGTDNATMIQAAIDYAVYFARCRAYIPAGTYRISKTLHLGYGSGLESCFIEGDGKKLRGESGFTGTAILADYSAGPGYAVSGARSTRIQSLSMMGQNFGWIEANNLGVAVAGLDDTTIANWIDPALDANANSRYTPYAAVAVDPYAGAQPGTHYPDVTFPAFTAISTQYGKAASSRLEIENCYFGGFVAMLAIQPSDADGNGDFIKLTGVEGEKFAYIISAGNTQGRQVSAINCSFGGFHSGIVNTVHGRQAGQLDFTSVSSDWANCIQIIDVGDAANAGHFTFIGGYSESLWRIGNWGANAGGNSPIAFDGYIFQFTLQNDKRGIPLDVFKSGGLVPVALRNCQLINYRGVLMLNTSNDGVRIENCTSESGVRANAYEQIAHSFLGGSIMMNVSNSRPNVPMAFTNKETNLYDADGGALGVGFLGDVSISSRAQPLMAWSPRTRAKSQFAYKRETPILWSAADKAGFSSLSLSGSTLTGTFAARSDQEFYYNGGLPGDVIYDDNSHSVFFVRSRIGTTFIAELQNNKKVTGGSFDVAGNTTGGGAVGTLAAFSAVSGNLYFGNSRFYLPTKFLRGDTSTSSAVISNCGRDDGFSAWMDAEILAGDYVFVDELQDRLFAPSDTLIAAVDGTAKTITLSGNAARNSTVKQLGLFIRQPPANV